MTSPGQTTDDGRGKIFPCLECGADLVFHIGQQVMACPYCGAERKIELSTDAKIVEQDYQLAIQKLQELKENKQDQEPEHSEVRCESCGSNVIFNGTLTSTECPYCGSPIQREKVHAGGFRIPVDGVLPFKIGHDQAHLLLKDWVKSRWFAPNDFKKKGVQGKFNGVYLPFWTYDSLTFNRYSGERGDNYTVTVGTGKDQRTETRTRWSSASGQFQRFFDDVLINGSDEFAKSKIEDLSPWPLGDSLPFTQEVLAGYFARTYDIDVAVGFSIARGRIDSAIHQDVCGRIGGDKQRVDKINTRYDAITFKHMLLPVWILAYIYKGKSYSIFINAGTGEVQGERPYSWVKITFTVLSVLVIVGIAAAIFQS